MRTTLIVRETRPQNRPAWRIHTKNFLLFFDKHVIGARFYCFSLTQNYIRSLRSCYEGRRGEKEGGKKGKREKTKTGGGKKGKRKSVITTNHLADERILYFRGTILPAVAKRELSHLFVLLSCKLLGQFLKPDETKNNEKEREREKNTYIHIYICIYIYAL